MRLSVLCEELGLPAALVLLTGAVSLAASTVAARPSFDPLLEVDTRSLLTADYSVDRDPVRLAPLDPGIVEAWSADEGRSATALPRRVPQLPAGGSTAPEAHTESGPHPATPAPPAQPTVSEVPEPRSAPSGELSPEPAPASVPPSSTPPPEAAPTPAPTTPLEPASPLLDTLAPVLEPVAPILEPVASVVDAAAPALEPLGPAIEPVAPLIEGVSGGLPDPLSLPGGLGG